MLSGAMNQVQRIGLHSKTQQWGLSQSIASWLGDGRLTGNSSQPASGGLFCGRQARVIQDEHLVHHLAAWLTGTEPGFRRPKINKALYC